MVRRYRCDQLPVPGSNPVQDDTCLAEIRIRNASPMAAMARLTRIWWCNIISFASKFKLCKSPVTSTLLYGCEKWTLLADSEKRIQALNNKSLRKLFLESPAWRTRPTTGRRTRSTPLWVHRNHFWQLSRDGCSHSSGVSYAMTASPEPSSRTPWRVSDTVVGRGNAGWTKSKSEHPCPCQNSSKWPPAEKIGKGSLLDHLSCPPPHDPIAQGTELSSTSL